MWSLSVLSLAVAVAGGLAQAAPVGAQTGQALSNAIAATCGTTLDARRQGVLAGTVTDSVSGVPLTNATVRIEWQLVGDSAASSAEVQTDAVGFYAFCGVPGGTAVLLTARHLKTSAPFTVGIESGMLHIQHVPIAVSDPEKPGVLTGRVVDAMSRRPVEGASVALEDGSRVLTNGRGYFSLGERPWGVYSLEVSGLGYATREVPVRVSGDFSQMAEVLLSAQPLEIEGVFVSALPRRSSRDLDGMVRRMNSGFGSFLTREVLERRPMARLFDFLREIPGVRGDQRGFDATMVVRGQRCSPHVYVDGVPFPIWDENTFVSQDLEAIEVYVGYAGIPAELMPPSTLGRPCAVVAVWTRAEW